MTYWNLAKLLQRALVEAKAIFILYEHTARTMHYDDAILLAALALPKPSLGH